MYHLGFSCVYWFNMDIPQPQRPGTMTAPLPLWLRSLGWRAGERDRQGGAKRERALGALVGHAVPWDDTIRVRYGTPENPAGPRLKAILMPLLDVEAGRSPLLPHVRGTGPHVDQPEPMPPWRDTEDLLSDPGIEGMGIERRHPNGLRKHQEGIRLRRVGLRDTGQGTAQEPEYPEPQEQAAPTSSAHHGFFRRRVWRRCATLPGEHARWR